MVLKPDPRKGDQDEQLAVMRQGLADSLHRTISDAESCWMFPTILVAAISNEVWAHPRKLRYATVPPMPLLKFVTEPYPTGLGTTVDIIVKLISDNPEAQLAWDRAVRGEHGGAHNPEGIGGKSGKQPIIVNVDNVNVDNGGTVRPTGNSADAGLRRLDKAAQAGDEKAADMLRRVLDPNDPMTVNGAAVIMGWRKPMISVVNTIESITDAAVKNGGPLKTVQRAWAKASQTEREEIANWVDEQMSPMRSSRFGR
jgi:hypothetical protein